MTPFRLFLSVILLFAFNVLEGQSKDMSKYIDSLLLIESNMPFNGVILISQNGKPIYAKKQGYADPEAKTPFEKNDQFVIGSVSKQFTAVLILRELDKGHLQLHVPIRRYLPELTQTWADTVTVHHLLTHTHGITQLNKPLAFKPGTKFSYSQLGYHLLASIVESTAKHSFDNMSADLFTKCAMLHTLHPNRPHPQLLPGYSEQVNGKLVHETRSLESFPAAGAFISTVSDLVLWNDQLFTGKLLSDSTLKKMCSKQPNALRDHPIFGITAYGYGLTVTTDEGLVQYGQTGFAPGFVSMNYYFPASKTSLVVLENMAYDPEHLKNTFYYHTRILSIVKNALKK